MNEKKKNTILIGFIILLFVLIIIQSIADCSAIRRADIKIDNLERELADAGRRVENCTRELEDSRGTIRKCYTSVGRIADNLAGQSTELSTVIANLKTVREEVENMENSLHFFYIKYNLDDNDFNYN